MRRHHDQIDTPFCLCANYNLGGQTNCAHNLVSNRVRDSLSPDLFELYLRLLFPNGKGRRNCSYITGDERSNRKWKYVNQAKRSIILCRELACDVKRRHGIVVEVDRTENFAKYLSHKASYGRTLHEVAVTAFIPERAFDVPSRLRDQLVF